MTKNYTAENSFGADPESAQPPTVPLGAKNGQHARNAKGEFDIGKRNTLFTFGGIKAFAYNRLLETFAVVVVFAGCLISLEPGFGHTPLWFIIASFMTLHFIAVVGCCVRYLLSCGCSNDLGMDSWTAFFRKSWWEMAYWCHTFAFSVSIAAALYLRFQVFYPALVPWGIYILDRLYGVFCSCAYNAQIVVEGQKSSYTVVDDDGTPNYLRLVLKKPRAFKYMAGQWCHLGFEHAGSYWGLPGSFLPFLQWHAFSIASCDQADNEFLEFHIGVHGSGRAGIDNLSNIRVEKPYFGGGLILNSSFTEWWCPHRVLAKDPGDLPEEVLGKKCQAEDNGVYLTLKPQDGVRELKILKPQEQWTGKLWSTVDALVHQRGSKNKYIRIMGPYGTMPATAFAHPALMLVSAGVGFPSSLSMLRKCLEDNLKKEQDGQQAVCFMWNVSKFEQLLLCFPSLLVDLTWYVHRKSKLICSDGKSGNFTRMALEDLKSWLTIKIFVGKVEINDTLILNPDQKLFPSAEDMSPALHEIRYWLLNAEVAPDSSMHFVDEDGTYIAQGSLGGSFGDILRCSKFTSEKVMKRPNSLGVCFCGPLDLSKWIQLEVENTVFPKTVEFASEATA